MKMEKKKVQQETKKEHRRVMVAVDEFLKVNENIDYTKNTLFDIFFNSFIRLIIIHIQIILNYKYHLMTNV